MSEQRLLGWSIEPTAIERDHVLVLVPSLGTSARIFDSLVHGLSMRKPDLGVMLADLPGHGLGPFASTVDIARVAGEVATVIELTQAKHASVLGVSMGGAVALETARLAPRGLAQFVMINSGAQFGTGEGWRALIETVESSGLEATRDGALSGWFSPGFARTERARELVAEIPRIDPMTYVACCRALAAYDGWPGVVDVETHGTLIGTADDLATPSSGLEALARSLPSADFYQLPSGGHLSLVEHSVAIETIVAHSLEL